MPSSFILKRIFSHKPIISGLVLGAAGISIARKTSKDEECREETESLIKIPRFMDDQKDTPDVIEKSPGININRGKERLIRRKEIGEDNEYTLKSVQIFFRHGARTPLNYLPCVPDVEYNVDFMSKFLPHCRIPIHVTDLEGGKRPQAWLDRNYKKKRFQGGMTAGVLTTSGQDQAYVLGRKLRERYIEEIPLLCEDSFDDTEIYIRSTNVQRCIESLRCVVAGMYKPSKCPYYNPINIPVDYKESEILFPNLNACPQLDLLKDQFQEDTKSNIEIVELTDKINQIINHEGSLNMMVWRDHIRCRQFHGLKMPEFFKEMQETIDTAAVQVLAGVMAGPKKHRDIGLQMAAGPMLQLVQDNFENIISGDDDKKMFLFSCHDSSLVPLLMSLNAFDGKWPEYCSYVALELYEECNTHEHYVHLSYCSKPLVPEGYESHILSLEEFNELICPVATTKDNYKGICALGAISALEQNVEKHFDNM